MCDHMVMLDLGLGGGHMPKHVTGLSQGHVGSLGPFEDVIDLVILSQDHVQRVSVLGHKLGVRRPADHMPVLGWSRGWSRASLSTVSPL